MEQVDILMVGHFARDELIVDGKGVVSAGGGVYYGSIVLRRMGLKVAIATRLNQADFPLLEELKSWKSSLRGRDVFFDALRRFRQQSLG